MRIYIILKLFCEIKAVVILNQNSDILDIIYNVSVY